MTEEHDNVISLVEAPKKALSRMTDSYLAGIGTMLKEVRGKASPKDQWAYHLYSGMVAERLKCNELGAKVESDQLRYIQAMAEVQERNRRLEDLIVKICDCPDLLYHLAPEDRKLVQSCYEP